MEKREIIRKIVCEAIAGTKDLTIAIDEIDNLSKPDPKILADFLIHTNKAGTIGKGSYLDQAKDFISKQS